jgi:hypothetical protein
MSNSGALLHSVEKRHHMNVSRERIINTFFRAGRRTHSSAYPPAHCGGNTSTKKVEAAMGPPSTTGQSSATVGRRKETQKQQTNEQENKRLGATGCKA